jgi:RND family efflux transporter MFP subunit
VTDRSKSSTVLLWCGGVVAAAGLALGGYFLAPGSAPASGAVDPGHAAPQEDERPTVEVVRPRAGGVERTTTQPGSVQAYERARLFAAVSGYLKTQPVDIGDRVKKGQLLAKIDVPELEKQVKQYRAALSQAQARISQMEARVSTAQADLLAKKAKIRQAQANIKSASAWVRFRKKQLERMKALLAEKAIDERLVDESQERYEAAVESENAALAALDTAKAEEAAAAASIKQADADVLEAKAEVEVDQARIEKAEILVQFSEIHAPYDGVITQRSLLPNDYVRAAREGGSGDPLLTVERTDRFRVVVQVPDRDVPFTDPDDPAFVEIDALPNKRYPAKVSRIASVEDPETRLMRVEVDVLNPDGKLHRGMYGRVTIILDRPADHLSLPTSCLVGKGEGERTSVYVVREGHVHLVPVKVGSDNGVSCAIQEGLLAKDEVVLHPGSELSDGAEVIVSQTAVTPPKQ